MKYLRAKLLLVYLAFLTSDHARKREFLGDSYEKRASKTMDEIESILIRRKDS